jgi:hypothetical protein
MRFQRMGKTKRRILPAGGTGKGEKKDGTPTKFLTAHQDGVNLVAVDVSQIILGMFDPDDCKSVTLSDPPVQDIKRRGIFGLFQEPEPQYPARIQSLAQSYAHIRQTLHGVLFLLRQPKTKLFNYSVKRFLAWNPRLINEDTAREICKEIEPPLPLFRKKGSIAEFVGKRAMEKGAPWKSPKAGLSPSSWKSRKSGGIPTFPTAPTTTG